MKITGLSVYISSFIYILMLSLAWAGESASAAVEIYADGRKYSTMEEYRVKRHQDDMAAAALRDEKLIELEHPVDLSPSVTMGEPDVNIITGKTVDLRPDGTIVITTNTTLDKTKTIEVKPLGRVAGVEPTFEKIAEDFDQAKPEAGGQPKKFATTDALMEDLRSTVRARQKPVLIINDRQKIKVMELNAVDAPTP
jgi:hypothetical protein